MIKVILPASILNEPQYRAEYSRDKWSVKLYCRNTDSWSEYRKLEPIPTMFAYTAWCDSVPLYWEKVFLPV